MASEGVGNNPRKVLFQRQRTAPERGGHHFCDATGLEKGDILSSKQRIQFDHELETSIRLLDRELHQQRLTALRELADKLQETSWKYPPIDQLLGL
ncbi:uncharacterized protein [Centruroides vittatus]|uniref:uncharacterized protein n=1 Tax=Centruroides vittatus TaxID=120091 RepID=UPI00350FE153